MVNIVKREIEGSPQFTEVQSKKVISKDEEFLTKNKLTKRIKPSQTSWKITRIFQKLIQLIVKFFTITYPNLKNRKIAHIIRAGGKDANHFISMTFSELWSHYRRFLSSDRQFNLKTANSFDLFSKDETEIFKLRSKKIQFFNKAKKAKKEEESTPITLDPKIKKEQAQLVNRKLQEIIKLPIGQARLFNIIRTQNVEDTIPFSEFSQGRLFLTITKNKNKKYTVRFVGDYSTMKDLAHQGKEIAIGGKNKVQRELCFLNVTEKELFSNDWLKELLTCWSDARPVSSEFIQARLAPLKKKQKEIESINDLTATSDRVDSLFWNVLNACQSESKKLSHREEKHLKLRANILSLFDMFQELRYDLKPHTVEYQTLLQTFEAISNRVYHAAKKGDLSPKQVQSIQQDLSIIEEALQKATKSSISISSTIRTRNIRAKRNENGKIASKKMKEMKWDAVTCPSSRDGVTPSDKTIVITSTKMIPPNIYDKIETKKEYLKIFRELGQNFSNESCSYLERRTHMKEFLRLLHESSFFFQPAVIASGTNSKDAYRNENSYWWNMNEAESIEIMDKINEFTKLFIEGTDLSQITQNEYESLIRMTQVVNFLNARLTGCWASEWDVIGDLFGYVNQRNHSDTGIRTPYRIHSNDNISQQFQRENKLYIEAMGKVFKKIKVNTALNDKMNRLTYQWKKEHAKEKFKFRDKSGKDVSVTEERLKWVKKQKEYINYIDVRTGEYKPSKWETWTQFFSSNQFLNLTLLSNWSRRITDPHLKLFQKFLITKAGRSYENNAFLKCPEAYEREPDTFFSNGFELFGDSSRYDWTRNALTPSSKEIINDWLAQPSQEFTLQEKKRLLNLFRSDAPQIELMAFIKEMPHLMRKPDVRNLVETLFFDTKLNDNNFHTLQTYLPSQIETEIGILEKSIEEMLRKKRISDPKLLQEKVDTLLFYCELKEKLRLKYTDMGALKGAFYSSKDTLEKIKEFCQKESTLQQCLGYVARVETRILLNEKQWDYPQIFRNFAIIKGKNVDPMNIDPYFEEELDYYWQQLLKEGEKDKVDFTSFLDQLCYHKDMMLNGSEWIKVKDFVYRNELYEVNLKTCEVSQLNSKISMKFLPPAIVSDSHFKTVMGSRLDWRAKCQEVENGHIYSLKDSQGQEVQIEEENGEFILYKKFNLDGQEKWLQSISKSKIFAPQISNDNETSIASFPYFNNGLYINPEKPASIYCVDAKGKISVSFKYKKTDTQIYFSAMVDYRSKKPMTFNNISTATDSNCEALNQLALFENRDKIVILGNWNQLKKVELPRYGLSFSYTSGRLVCNHPSYKDYSVDLGATSVEKKGLKHALVLQHSDPTKPKKLLIPGTKVILSTTKIHLPEAFGIGKALFYLKSAYNYIFNSTLPDINAEEVKEIDSTKKSIAYHSFDIRPYTGEICSRDKISDQDILELAKQALLLNHPTLAKEMLNMLEITPSTLNQTLLDHLSDFIQNEITGDGKEAALKIKLCMTLKTCLKHQKKLTPQLKDTLAKWLLNLTKKFFAQGSNIPKEMQLTEHERILLIEEVRKIDSNYYEEHLKATLLKNGETFNLLDPKSIPEDTTYSKKLKSANKTLPPKDIVDSISTLEKAINPTEALLDSDLKFTIPLLKSNEEIPLIDFSKKDENDLFKENKVKLPKLKFDPTKAKKKCERVALREAQKAVDEFRESEGQRPRHVICANKRKLKKFMYSKIVPQMVKHEEEIKKCRSAIEKMIRSSNLPMEQLAIYSGHQTIASFEELRQALVDGNLEELQKRGRLPSKLNIKKLNDKLLFFFSKLSQLNATTAAIKFAEEIEAKGNPNNKEEWESLSEGLYRLLTARRRYDAKKEPRLLVFEAQQFLNFKTLDGGLDQIDLLNELVANPYGIIQAPTGAGKTSVLSVMRTLLKANGKNLSIQKVLPSLYVQTHEKLKSVLGDLYGSSIYALQFNLKKPLTIQEVNNKGEKVVHSIFKRMYHDLLETITKKGCVLTDYKSLPLLEEMFFKFGDMLASGDIKDPIIEEHFNYLKNILILLNNKGDENMDEIDQPNRPINKTQLELGTRSKKLPEFIIEMCLSIYKELRTEPELGLLKNIQGDLSEKTRKEVIDRVADKFAVRLRKQSKNKLNKKKLLAYLKGDNEDILPSLNKLKPGLRDKISFCKDQFSTFLPLTLSYKSGSRYARSSDGKKVIPCYNGEKHDAKFGTILEQLNYAIQDFFQNGVTVADLKPWIEASKAAYDDEENEETQKGHLKQFQKRLPGYSFVRAAKMLEDQKGTNRLLKIINSDPKKIEFFLETHLSTIKTSGDLISMNPQNIVDMSRAVSGISATMGAPESLHQQFEVNSEMNRQIQASMLYRLNKRALTQEVIAYDPANPSKMLEELEGEPIHAIIDGAGAFKNPKKAAKMLKQASNELDQVFFYREDESMDFVGEEGEATSKVGIYFAQERTRGTDFKLAPSSKAILTLSAKDGIREFFQKEGRLRQERQRYILAMPKDQQIKTVTDEMQYAIAQDARIDADDIYRKCKQQLEAVLRSGKRKKLLECQTIDDFIKIFKDERYRKAFITGAESNFQDKGSYFAANQHIRQFNQKPKKSLNELKERLRKEALDLGLKDTVKMFDSITYGKELTEKMPSRVTSLVTSQVELENELQVETEGEFEQEQEFEIESQEEVEQAKATKPTGIHYPTRHPYEDYHSVREKIHKAFNEKIYVTDNFLPFSRNEESLLKRVPFDEYMYRIGQVYIQIEKDWVNKNKRIERVIIEDPLTTEGQMKENCYDIRTNALVQRNDTSSKSFDTFSDEFYLITAQIKFLDGRINGYLSKEKEMLKEWLNKLDAKGEITRSEMRHFFLNDVLRNREKEKKHFVESELEKCLV